MTRKQLSHAKKQSDRALANTVLNLRDAYGLQHQDPDGFRLGKKYFESLGKKMKENVKEVFNRVGKNGSLKHKPLQPLFSELSQLNAKQRKDAEEIYQALRGIQRNEL